MADWGEAILYRITATGLAKGYTDTRVTNFSAIREMGFYDYAADPDDRDGATRDIILIDPSGATLVSEIRWYRADERGDPRFRISGLRNFVAPGDLLALGAKDGFAVARNLSVFVDGEGDDDGSREIVPLSGHEGRWVERVHRSRERNRWIVNEKKRIARESPEGLMCEACGFAPVAAFGEKAESSIEAHHIIPLADLPSSGTHTTVNDLVLLCATCHRLIHSLDLTVPELASARTATAGE